MEDIPMNDKDKDKQVEKLINLLGCSMSEALDIIQSDYRIDKGEKLFELTPEQKKAAKSVIITTSGKERKKTKKTKKRIKKKDHNKLSLMNNIIDSLNSCVQDINIINPEREITFMYNDKKYKLVLSVPRK